MIGREDEVRHFRDRIWYCIFIVLFFFILIGSRLFYLQIAKGDDLRRYSEANRLKKERLLPTRGILYDRDGKVVVDSRASFDVVMLSQYYPFTDEINQRLAQVLGMELPDLKRKLAKANASPRFIPILLKADVSKDVIAGIEMDVEGFPGIDIEATVIRRYSYGENAAQILGYVGQVNSREIRRYKALKLKPRDYIGKVGLERIYDSFLRGRNGVGYVEVDARGRRRKHEGKELLGFVAREEPLPGNNLHLTLSMDLQQAAEKAMKSREYLGSVVALDPRSGEVLAMVNTPSYLPSSISGREVSPQVWKALRENKDRPLRNRAIQDHYPPGSTFKLLVAIGALSEGIANTETKVFCPGHLKFGRRRFHCWKRGGHGKIDFIGAIRESCNVFFYKMGIQLGVDTIAKYARLFGLGSRTGVQMDGEVPGIIPDTEWKKKRFNEPWHPGETLSVAIGQGYVTATPIQLATAFAAIGNGGFVYRPFLLSQIKGRGGEVIQESKSKLVRKVDVPSEVIDIVKEGLWQVSNVRGGTGYWHRSKIVEISGKTGTSQVRRFKNIQSKKCENLDYKERQHGWFVGYAPRENPEIVVAAIGEHTCHGTSAAPVVRDVVDAYFKGQELAPKLGERTVAGEEEGR